jgi:hypothetical protein
MARLKKQFKTALSKIEPGADKANAVEAHRLVRDALAADPTLALCGICAVLIGSYRRQVSIRRIKDVDVFVRLLGLPDDVTSKEILDRVFNVLDAAFGLDRDGHHRTKRQDRSIQVSFPEFDLYVDAVPARPHADGETWEIPQKGDLDKWLHTNPEELTALSSAMNSAHNEFYVPTVKLLRQTRRTLLGKGKKPGGFFVEVAAYLGFESGLVTGTCQAEYYVSALREVSAIITKFVDLGIELEDPTLPGETIKIRATDEELRRARDEFADAADRAEVALDDENEGQASLAFQKLLGKDPDGDFVFPMADGFKADGSKRWEGATPGDRIVPAGAKTFG